MDERAKDQVEKHGASAQLLTFIVDTEEYGVEILRVQEIRGWSKPMPIPNTPSYVLGVINIRGDIVPIADLRERLGMARRPHGPTTAVVVLRVAEGARQRVMGIVVDAMSDVTDVAADQIKPPPEFGLASDAGLTKGIATLADKMVTILEVDRIFPSTVAGVTGITAAT
jgi:purine-binding chemotaxis protein CheW